jgi:hypothetical protein
MTTVDPTTHDPNSSSTAPAQIYIIRHGEKPADLAPPAPNQPPPVPGPPFGVDFDGNQDIHSLLPRGWQRSGALTVLFAPAEGALRPGIRTPGALFSPSYGDPAKTQSHRTYETIYGLSQRSGAPINSPVQEGQEPALAAVVLKGSAPVVLICWEHQHIPALALALPTVPGTTIPDPWPGDRFDVIWSFTVVSGLQDVQYTFSQIPQQLLAGDTDTVLS